MHYRLSRCSKCDQSHSHDHHNEHAVGPFGQGLVSQIGDSSNAAVGFGKVQMLPYCNSPSHGGDRATLDEFVCCSDYYYYYTKHG